jgi:hypothetical protein
MSIRNLPGAKRRPASKADNPTAICENVNPDTNRPDEDEYGRATLSSAVTEEITRRGRKTN